MAIHNYHASHRRTITFRKWDNAQNKLRAYLPTCQLNVGVELEVDEFRNYNADSTSDKVDTLMGNLATCEYDGSLHNGFEIITQPATVEAFIKGFKVDELCALLDSEGAKSHDTEKAGLHVHVSRAALGQSERARDMVCAKILVLMDKFESQLIKFARRDYTRNGYCCKYSGFNADGENSTTKLLEKYKPCKESGDRYHSLNLTNEATIEFRIFKGTLNPLALKATVELCETIVEYCKCHTTPQIQTCTWAEVIDTCKWPELTEYCGKRNIA